MIRGFDTHTHTHTHNPPKNSVVSFEILRFNTFFENTTRNYNRMLRKFGGSYI